MQKKAFLWLERDITTRCLHNACRRKCIFCNKKKLQEQEFVMFRSILDGSYAINGESSKITPRAIKINMIFVVYFCTKRHQ